MKLQFNMIVSTVQSELQIFLMLFENIHKDFFLTHSANEIRLFKFCDCFFGILFTNTE